MKPQSASEAFFSGINPYTGVPMNRPGTSSPSTPSGANTPSESYTPAKPRTNPNEVLDPLYAAQQSIRYAKSSLGQVRSSWNSVGREINGAENSASRAENYIYPAENDTEERNVSSAGRDTESELSSIERTLSQLAYNSSADSAIYEVKYRVSDAKGHLQRVDSGRLKDSWRYDEAVRSISQFESLIYRIESSQDRIESQIGSSQTALQRTRYDVKTVAGDHDGQNVSSQARNARYNIRTLQSSLKETTQQLTYSESDLREAERLLESADGNISQAHSDFQYAWHTSDGRQ